MHCDEPCVCSKCTLRSMEYANEACKAILQTWIHTMCSLSKSVGRLCLLETVWLRLATRRNPSSRPIRGGQDLALREGCRGSSTRQLEHKSSNTAHRYHAEPHSTLGPRTSNWRNINTCRALWLNQLLGEDEVGREGQDSVTPSTAALTHTRNHQPVRHLIFSINIQ
jgi:hypothetical protein